MNRRKKQRSLWDKTILLATSGYVLGALAAMQFAPKPLQRWLGNLLATSPGSRRERYSSTSV